MDKKKNIKEILEKISKVLEMSCEKDFDCSKVGINNCCIAAIREQGLVLEVFEKNPPKECKFLRQDRFRFFCDCPIHYYIRKQPKKILSKKSC